MRTAKLHIFLLLLLGWIFQGGSQAVCPVRNMIDQGSVSGGIEKSLENGKNLAVGVGKQAIAATALTNPALMLNPQVREIFNEQVDDFTGAGLPTNADRLGHTVTNIALCLAPEAIAAKVKAAKALDEAKVIPEATASVKPPPLPAPDPPAAPIPPAANSGTRVGRWMSPAEYEAMKTSGVVQADTAGMHRVAVPATPSAYKAAPKGDIYVEYDLPSSSLSPGGTDGWRTVHGPGSPAARLAEKKGLPTPELPKFENLSDPLQTK